jgi:TPR repeat protein
MVLLLLSVAVLQLPAQQTEADRKQFEADKVRAEAGDPNSENQLGVRYATGQGVSKDLAEAAKWYRKAAETESRSGSIQSWSVLPQGRRRGEGLS